MPRAALAILVVAGCLLLCPGMGVAAGFALLANSGQLRLPEDVAAGPGRLYVADASASLIRVFDQHGARIGDIGFPSPIAVALLPDNTLAAASASERSVWLLSPAGRPLLALGRGEGEFSLPRNIVVDPDRARIGVVDPPAGVLKWYDYNGLPLDTIDDRGNLPQDAAVLDGEIFVIDHPVIFTPEGEQARGAAIRVFSAEGQPMRLFTLPGEEGNGTAPMVRPRSITAGSQGTLFVVDGFHGVVVEVSPAGERLATIAPPGRSLRGASGAAMLDGRLYVAVTLDGVLARFDLAPLAGGDGTARRPGSPAPP